MTTHAFLRVSTLLQDTEKNKIDILQFANHMKLGNVEFTEERASGKINYKERKLGALIDRLNTGDVLMLMYGKEASNRKQEIDRQHYTIPNQRPKDKHCGKI